MKEEPNYEQHQQLVVQHHYRKISQGTYIGI
jgi:hypothetical protein